MMTCPVHPFKTQGLSSVGESKIHDFHADRQPFFGPYTRKAREVRDQLTERALDAIRGTRIVRLMPTAVQTTLSRNDAQQPVRDLIREIYSEVGLTFAERTQDQLQKQEPLPDAWSQEVERWMASKEAAAEIRGITETVRKDVTKALQQGIDEGLGSEQIAARVEDTMEQANRVRARTIARTEVITSSNQATHFTARRQNPNLIKVWSAINDPRTRTTHAETDGQEVRMSETFSVGGFTARFPADPNLPAAERIQCRCTIFFREPSDSSLPERGSTV